MAAVATSYARSSSWSAPLNRPDMSEQRMQQERISDMKTLGVAVHAARDGTGEVQHLLASTTFHPRLPGLTKMVSRLGKEGCWRKALEIYQSLPQTGIRPDTAITNAAISACDKGGQWRAALSIYESMDGQGLRQDAITCSSLISALAKGKQWALALQVFDDMQARGVLADVVTCCSLINALERGGQWQLAEQLFVQMCTASWQAHGVNSPLYRIMEIAAAPWPPLHGESSPTEQAPGLSDAQSSSLEHTDSDRALVMYASSLVGTSSQQSIALTSAMYTAPMPSSSAPAPSPPRSVPRPPAGGSLDSSLSSSFQKHHSGSPADQIKGSQPGRPYVSTPDKQPCLGTQGSRSNPQMYRSDSNKPSLDPTNAIGREADSAVMQTPLYQTQAPDAHPTSSSSSRSVSKGTTSLAMHTPPYRHPSAEFKPASSGSSDHIPKYVQADSSLEVIPSATQGLGKPSSDSAAPIDSSADSSQTGRAESSELLRSFTNMRVGSQPVQRVLFPPEFSPQQPSLHHRTLPGINQGNSRSFAKQNSSSHGDSHQPAQQQQAALFHDNTTQGSPMHQNIYTQAQQTEYHQVNFPQAITPLRGLLHQSSLNSIGSHRPLRPHSSFTQSSSEAGMLCSQMRLGHQGSFTPGSSESGVLRQQDSFGGGHSPDEGSEATVRRIQEAAADRQELLSLTPTTTPVGGSWGQAPVLRHMNVSQIAPNRVCCNALLAAYARAKPTCWQKALAFLEVMQSGECHIRPDTVTYNTVLKACCNAGQLSHARQVFVTMLQSRVELTITTFGTLLVAGAQAHDYSLVQEVWGHLEHAGLEANPACMNAYMQALVHQGEWSEAQKHFKNLLGRGSRVRAPVVTINTIMAAYMKQGMFDQVQQVFDDMYTAGLLPNIMTYITLLSSYAELGNWQNALHLIKHMCLPTVAIVPNTLAFNHVLATLLKAATQPCTPELRAGLAESGVSLFNQMLNRSRTPPDCNTYDTLISLMLEVGAAGQALHVHQLKTQQGLAMNAVGLSRIVAGCCQSGQCEEAYAGWAMMQAAGVHPDTACLNALLAALHGAKHWQRAVHVFQAARQGQVQLDTTCYNKVLAVLVDAEQLEGGLSLMSDMQAQGVLLEEASCDRLLMLLLMAGELQVACKVTLGLLARGQACGAEPTGCLVHLLKEDGQVWQALSIIKLSLQVAPSLRIEATEYTSLAEKALTSCGMGPAVWLLVQLHQAHAIRLYQLPGQSRSAGAGAVPDTAAKGSSADSTPSPPTAIKSSPQSPASAATSISKVRVQADAGEEGQTWNNPRGPLEEQPYSTTMLIGTSVDVAIIVVLSWAAQLVQLDVTSHMMQNGNITFELGGPNASEDPAAVCSALQKLLDRPAMHPETVSTHLTAEEAWSSSQGKVPLEVPMQHIFSWIGKHREVLQKLLLDGEAFAASQLPLAR